MGSIILEHKFQTIYGLYDRTDEGRVNCKEILCSRSGDIFRYLTIHVGDTKCGGIFVNDGPSMIVEDNDGNLDFAENNSMETERIRSLIDFLDKHATTDVIH